MTTQERLQNLGLEKVSDLARFIEDFQLLGFDSKTVRKMSERSSRKKGSLEKQLASLGKKKIAREQKVRVEGGTHASLGEMNTLRDEVSRLSRLGYALRDGRLTLPCKVCQMQGVSMDLTRVEGTIMKGPWCSGMCVFTSSLNLSGIAFPSCNLYYPFCWVYQRIRQESEPFCRENLF